MLAIFVQLCFYFGITNGEQYVVPVNTSTITVQENSTVTLQWNFFEEKMLPTDKLSRLKFYCYSSGNINHLSHRGKMLIWSQDKPNTYTFEDEKMKFTVLKPYYPHFIVRVENIIAGYTGFTLEGEVNHGNIGRTIFQRAPISMAIIGKIFYLFFY